MYKMLAVLSLLPREGQTIHNFYDLLTDTFPTI